MSKIRIINYSFNKASKQIVFLDYTSISLDGLLLVTNVTDNTIIYNFADPIRGGTVSGNVLTLSYDTSGMSDTDSLQIFYDDPAISPATETTAELLVALSEDIESSVFLLKRIAKILEPISTQDVQQRQRVIIDNIITGSIATVSTVYNMQSLGGVDYRWMMIDQARNTYANGIRNNITF
jgi:hypothetical protein